MTTPSTRAAERQPSLEPELRASVTREAANDAAPANGGPPPPRMPMLPRRLVAVATKTL